MSSTCKIDEDGTKRWRNSKNQHHREDGLAVEGADGSKEWYKNGQLHREDGPAIEYASGSKSWYLNGKLHREDGPAYEGSDGTKAWYLNGQAYFFKNYCNELLKRKLITEANLSLFRLRYGE